LKAYEIFTGMLIFDLMCFTIDLTGIYPLGFGTGFNAMDAMAVFVASITGAVASQALIGFFSGREASSNRFVYVAIGTTYWGTFYATASIIDSIIAPLSGYSPAIRFMAFTLFIIMAGYVFVSGIAQMVTGGWKSYK